MVLATTRDAADSAAADPHGDRTAPGDPLRRRLERINRRTVPGTSSIRGWGIDWRTRASGGKFMRAYLSFSVGLNGLPSRPIVPGFTSRRRNSAPDQAHKLRPEAVRFR